MAVVVLNEEDLRRILREEIRRVVREELRLPLVAEQPSVAQELWDVRQVATYLRASESWVYKLASSRRIPCQRTGRLLRFRKDEIDAWLSRGGSPDGDACL